MVAKVVDVRQAETTISELLARVQRGDEFLLVDGTRPVARLLPVAGSEAVRQPGLHPGAIAAADDFDTPLPDEFWTEGG